LRYECVVARYISLLLIFSVKLFTKLFYRFEMSYVGDVPPGDPWKGTRIIMVLNHTSLFEPLFLGLLPNWLLRELSGKLAIPLADKTLNRPIVGTFFKWLAPRMISVSRKRDSTWSNFLQVAVRDSIVIILPEGRMKRRNGLDSHGKPMSIRGGVGDVLNAMDGGQMAIAYSGGLHHIQAPGDWFPRLFKTIRVNVEFLDIMTYKQELGAGSIHEYKLAVVEDLTERQRRYTPLPFPS
jgi:1-acyl-sn-glycerol-3-phosphate acyltransferase